jgi:hypothetical protein
LLTHTILVEAVGLPLAFEKTGYDAVIVTESTANSPLVFEPKLLEELASATQLLRRQAGDPIAFELIECVAHDARNETRRQPVRANRGKTDLYVAVLGLILIEDHAADKIIVLIDNPDSLAWAPIQSMPDLVRYPLSDERREWARD